jgi:small GTP-binding protein
MSKPARHSQRADAQDELDRQPISANSWRPVHAAAQPYAADEDEALRQYEQMEAEADPASTSGIPPSCHCVRRSNLGCAERLFELLPTPPAKHPVYLDIPTTVVFSRTAPTRWYHTLPNGRLTVHQEHELTLSGILASFAPGVFPSTANSHEIQRQTVPEGLHGVASSFLARDIAPSDLTALDEDSEEIYAQFVYSSSYTLAPDQHYIVYLTATELLRLLRDINSDLHNPTVFGVLQRFVRPGGWPGEQKHQPTRTLSSLEQEARTRQQVFKVTWAPHYMRVDRRVNKRSYVPPRHTIPRGANPLLHPAAPPKEDVFLRLATFDGPNELSEFTAMRMDHPAQRQRFDALCESLVKAIERGGSPAFPGDAEAGVAAGRCTTRVKYLELYCKLSLTPPQVGKSSAATLLYARSIRAIDERALDRLAAEQAASGGADASASAGGAAASKQTQPTCLQCGKCVDFSLPEALLESPVAAEAGNHPTLRPQSAAAGQGRVMKKSASRFNFEEKETAQADGLGEQHQQQEWHSFPPEEQRLVLVPSSDDSSVAVQIPQPQQRSRPTTAVPRHLREHPTSFSSALTPYELSAAVNFDLLAPLPTHLPIAPSGRPRSVAEFFAASPAVGRRVHKEHRLIPSAIGGASSFDFPSPLPVTGLARYEKSVLGVYVHASAETSRRRALRIAMQAARPQSTTTGYRKGMRTPSVSLFRHKEGQTNLKWSNLSNLKPNQPQTAAEPLQEGAIPSLSSLFASTSLAPAGSQTSRPLTAAPRIKPSAPSSSSRGKSGLALWAEGVHRLYEKNRRREQQRKSPPKAPSSQSSHQQEEEKQPEEHPKPQNGSANVEDARTQNHQLVRNLFDEIAPLPKASPPKKRRPAPEAQPLPPPAAVVVEEKVPDAPAPAPPTAPRRPLHNRPHSRDHLSQSRRLTQMEQDPLAKQLRAQSAKRRAREDRMKSPPRRSHHRPSSSYVRGPERNETTKMEMLYQLDPDGEGVLPPPGDADADYVPNPFAEITSATASNRPQSAPRLRIKAPIPPSDALFKPLHTTVRLPAPPSSTSVSSFHRPRPYTVEKGRTAAAAGGGGKEELTRLPGSLPFERLLKKGEKAPSLGVEATAADNRVDADQDDSDAVDDDNAEADTDISAAAQASEDAAPAVPFSPRAPQRMSLKLVLCGEEHIGKSSLAAAYESGGEFQTLSSEDVRESFTKQFTIDDQLVELAVHDTRGSSDHDRTRPLSYADTDVFLLCFSITSGASFDAVTQRWQKELEHHAPGVPIVLCGLQTDLRDSSPSASLSLIPRTRGTDLAKTIGALSYLECGKGKEVDKVFVSAAKAALRHAHPGLVRTTSLAPAAPLLTSYADVPAMRVGHKRPSDSASRKRATAAIIAEAIGANQQASVETKPEGGKRRSQVAREKTAELAALSAAAKEKARAAAAAGAGASPAAPAPTASVSPRADDPEETYSENDDDGSYVADADFTALASEVADDLSSFASEFLTRSDPAPSPPVVPSSTSPTVNPMQLPRASASSVQNVLSPVGGPVGQQWEADDRPTADDAAKEDSEEEYEVEEADDAVELEYAQGDPPHDVVAAPRPPTSQEEQWQLSPMPPSPPRHHEHPTIEDEEYDAESFD